MKPEAEIRDAFLVLERLETLAEHFAAKGRHTAAAACAQMAASYAFTNHCGVFASPRLERVLRIVGAAAVQGTVRHSRPETPGHILHVLSHARPVGGDSRFAWRWIRADSSRKHSVALTNQGHLEIPALLREAVDSRGGRTHVLSAPAADPIARARQLSEIAREVDLVALHLFPDDVVPALAFADQKSSPPVVYVHHSDHTFWIGSGGCDIIGQLRDSDSQFLQARRGFDLDRLACLPIPLDPPIRSASRSEAKRRLGYTDGDVILLTIATDFKYQSSESPTFVDLVVRALNKHPNARLIAVGPADTGEWAQAREATGGRVTALGRRSDTAQFYESADIYVDSFPFTSITSVLEAGTYGIPMIAYCPHVVEAQLLCAGAPGLTDTLLRTCGIDRYESELSALIDDPMSRERRGAAAANAILGIHTGTGWLANLEALYKRALTERRPRTMPLGEVTMQTGALDRRVRLVMGRVSGGLMIHEYVGPLPYVSRVYTLFKLLHVDRSLSLSMFLPGPLQTLAQRRPPWLGKLLRRAIP